MRNANLHLLSGYGHDNVSLQYHHPLLSRTKGTSKPQSKPRSVHTVHNLHDTSKPRASPSRNMRGVPDVNRQSANVNVNPQSR